MAAQLERTYIMIKPDGVQRGLVGTIIARFEAKGYKLAAMKMAQPGRAHMEKHYEDLKSKKFFPGLIEYMTSGPVICMVWQGMDAVATGRKMLGATKPTDSEPGTIRGDLCIDVGRNICHGSDAVESAENEIALWFPEGTCEWTSCEQAWLYEDAPPAKPAAEVPVDKRTKDGPDWNADKVARKLADAPEIDPDLDIAAMRAKAQGAKMSEEEKKARGLLYDTSKASAIRDEPDEDDEGACDFDGGFDWDMEGGDEEKVSGSPDPIDEKFEAYMREQGLDD